MLMGNQPQDEFSRARGEDARPVLLRRVGGRAELSLEAEELEWEPSPDPREKYSMRVTTTGFSYMIGGNVLGSWFGCAQSLKGSRSGGSRRSFGDC